MQTLAMPIATDFAADMNADIPPPTLPELKQVVQGWKNFQVLHSAMHCGLFDWLDAHGPTGKPELVNALGLRGAHSGAWLQCLVELGCLHMQDAQYALNPAWRDLLVSQGNWSSASWLQDLTQPNGRWSALADFMREDKHLALRPPAALSAYGQGLHPLRTDAQALVQRLLRHPRVAAAQTVLCFDASEGVLAALLHQALEPASMQVVVPQAQLEAARTSLGKHASCTLQAGSPMWFGAQGKFDLVMLFHSLYAVRKTTNDALAAVAAALAPGGLLCAAHWFCLEACEPAPGGLNQLEQAIINDFHPMCHVETFCDRLTNLGLTDATREDLAGQYGTVKLHFANQP